MPIDLAILLTELISIGIVFVEIQSLYLCLQKMSTTHFNLFWDRAITHPYFAIHCTNTEHEPVYSCRVYSLERAADSSAGGREK